MISQETFELVLARAIELDEKGILSERRAKEIAIELGVSAAAWDAAFADYSRSRRTLETPTEPAAISPLRQGLIAIGGLALGAIAGASEAGIGGHSDLSSWVTAVPPVILSIGLLAANAIKRAHWRFQADVLALWLPFPIGFTLAYGRFFDDVLVFAIGSWLLSAVIGGAVLFTRRRDREHQGTGREPGSGT